MFYFYQNYGCLVLFFLGFASSLCAQSHIHTNNYHREYTSLNGSWHYIIDPYENGYYNYRYEAFDQQEQPWASAFFLNSKPKDKSDLIEYDFDKMDVLEVPGDWNSQSPKLEYYEGTIWYKKSFDYKKSDASNRVFLYFGAINYKAEVYLNGNKLGTHIGGFTPFQYEITEHVKPSENHLIVKVDNKRIKEGVPTLNTDWWNYGGITRDVKIIETPEALVKNYVIQLSKEKKNTIVAKFSVSNPSGDDQKLRLHIPGLAINAEISSEKLNEFEWSGYRDHIQYWSPENPKRYHVEIQYGEDKMIDSIGFRSIETNGSKILLNGESIFLKGISIHEESPIRGGRAYSIEDAKILLGHAKSLGCNFVRLAHYPHNEHMIRTADRLGLLVWEEIPVYWTIDWDNPNTYQNAEDQIASIISRDINRASAIIWSMANETPNSKSRNKFLNKLAAFTKQKDPTRLLSAALEQKDDPVLENTRTISDPFADVVDVLSFNQYIGWYDGTVEKCNKIKWNITQDKPVLISEFGAGAKYGFHGDKTERWTEEYQEYLYQETLKMIDQVDQLRGVSPWILMDFKSPRRVLPKIQDNYNRKGLLSEKGEKKKAFYVLQKYYQSK